ncbi:MAG: hypothetical protein LC737_08795 [Chloroflexi bacterium]|nr:hypothetical protein [Chloroflexota bacterium]
MYGLEVHLVLVHQLVEEVRPNIAVSDPITNLISIANSLEGKVRLTRLVDYLKRDHITTVLTSLTLGGRIRARGRTEVPANA